MLSLIRAVALLAFLVSTVSADETPKGNYILNLYDAFGKKIHGTTQDFGFSALVKYNGLTILFDGGTNADLLKSNCAALGVDLAEVDFAVASHSHFDHINGFDYLLQVNPKVKIYFPDDFYWGAPFQFDPSSLAPEAAAELPVELKYFGGDSAMFTFRQSGRFWGADVEFVKESRQIAEGVNLISTSSPFVGYFSSYPDVNESETDSGSAPLHKIELPELSLSLNTPQGEVLIVGCSHSLVVKIVDETMQTLNRDIALVMGGYHLLPYETADITDMALELRDVMAVKAVAPAHCTGPLGFKIFLETFGDKYHMAGLGSVIEF